MSIWRYGYIEFDDATAAEKAAKAMQGASIDGRPIRVDFASEMQAPPSTFNGKRKTATIIVLYCIV